MIPRKIFTNFAKFLGIVSVNDFWFPRRLQELLWGLFCFVRSFGCARIRLTLMVFGLLGRTRQTSKRTLGRPLFHQRQRRSSSLLNCPSASRKHFQCPRSRTVTLELGGRSACLRCPYVGLTVHWAASPAFYGRGVRQASDRVGSDPGARFSWTPAEQCHTVSEIAGFVRTVSKGMYYKTVEDVDDGFGNFITSCRAYILSRTHPESEAKLWSYKYTWIGIVLGLKVICHHYVHGIEIQIPSTSG